ncbi:CHAT domain-containing protein [Lentzea indica]|uniref:CHAT domain-containing protein n=1 Tax=Lentzea indica TaxID=2604800 RepID=UPI00143AD88F|nr:CHAT domain-containing protein [Lentzea indica]
MRQIDGFEHFGEPVPYSRLRSAATGPAVIVNVSVLGCHALVVQASADHAEAIALDDLTAVAAAEHADLLFAILGRRPDVVVPPEDRNPLLLKILTWLWTSTVSHVLDHPSVARALAENPRIWWCATGSMAVLPLHAAGRYGEDGAADVTVSARAVSSYTPTLSALLRCRAAERDFRDEPARQLAVGLPETPGMTSLPAVRRELTHLRHHFPNGRQLVGEDATREEVLVSLGSCSWVHWACHGEQDNDDPAQSAFHVWDGPVTMSDLSAVSPTGVELAFLSACNTATGTTRLVDEALHLAATTQLLGYPHVVATLWSIEDFEAPGVTDGFYRRLSTTGRPRSAGAAQALHESIEELRRSAADEPLVWAPYVHFGP